MLRTALVFLAAGAVGLMLGVLSLDGLGGVFAGAAKLFSFVAIALVLVLVVAGVIVAKKMAD